MRRRMRGKTASAGTGVDYLDAALALSPIALLDGTSDLLSSATWSGVTTVSGPDGLTGVTESGGPGSIAVAGPTDSATFVCLLRGPSGGLGTDTTKPTIMTNAGSMSAWLPYHRRDASFNQHVNIEWGPYTASSVDVGTQIASEQWTLVATAIEPNGGTPTNTDIYHYGGGNDGVLVESSSLNRGSNTRPNGSAVTVHCPASYGNFYGLAGVAIFDYRLSSAEIQSLLDTLPTVTT